MQTLVQITKTLAIVIGEEFIQNKNFSPLISNYGTLYKMDGTCLVAGKNKLYTRTTDEVQANLIKAREVFDKLCGNTPAQTPAPAMAQTPAPAPQTSPAYDAFQTLMMSALSQASMQGILENVIPMLEEHIQKTYGALPQLHEFRINELPAKVESEVYHKQFDRMLKLLLKGRYIYLHGPAGTGKSYIGEQVAQVLNIPFYPQSKIEIAYDLMGFNDASGKFVETNFYKAWTQGGLFLLDELDRSDANAVITLNNALASKYFTFANGTFPKHKDFHCIATGNTIGTGANMQYVTAQKMDESTRNRFFFFEVNYDRELELMFAQGDTDLVDFAHDFRSACKEIGFDAIFSYRDISRVKELQELFDGEMSMQEMFETCSFVGIDTDTKVQIYENLRDKANKYAKGLK